MKNLMFLVCIIASLSFTTIAQNLKVKTIIPLETGNGSIDFPVDLNGKKCALIEVQLNNESVAFEGNVVGTPSYHEGVYQIFMAPNSKYLNIKYPSEEPLMIRFSDYNVDSMPSMAIYRIAMKEPSSNLSEQLDSGIEEVSQEAEEYYEIGGNLLTQNNYIQAFEYFTKACELGHPKAAYLLGFIYSDPYHAVRGNKLARNMVDIPETPVKRDMEKAFSFYKQSAEAGYVTAQYAVGECLEKGEGVKKNKDEALIW